MISFWIKAANYLVPIRYKIPRQRKSLIISVKTEKIAAFYLVKAVLVYVLYNFENKNGNNVSGVNFSLHPNSVFISIVAGAWSAIWRPYGGMRIRSQLKKAPITAPAFAH